MADTGRGIGPEPATPPARASGLPLIAALTDSLEVERTPSAGSRLMMRFLRHRPAPAMGIA